MEKRHYEVLLVFRHLQEDKVDELINKYKDLFNKDGEVTRFENWGVRQLAYHIDGFSRALYVLFNVNCPGTTVDELEKLWKFDDMLLRHLVFRCKDAITEESPILTATKSKSSARDNIDENLDKEALRSEFQRGLKGDAKQAAVAPAMEAGAEDKSTDAAEDAGDATDKGADAEANADDKADAGDAEDKSTDDSKGDSVEEASTTDADSTDTASPADDSDASQADAKAEDAKGEDAKAEDAKAAADENEDSKDKQEEQDK